VAQPTARHRPTNDPGRHSPPDQARISRRRLCRDGMLLLTLGTTPVLGLVAGCGNDADGDNTAGNDTASNGEASDGDAGSEEAAAGDGPVMYSSPTCGCCSEYATYLRANGHPVEVSHIDDLAEIKSRYGIPAEAEGCHTTVIDGYTIEGHVPVEAIDRLLAERPAIDGIALPDMPAGSPGMSGPKQAPFEVLSLTNGSTQPYMTL
jgi:hypothetical protein